MEKDLCLESTYPIPPDHADFKVHLNLDEYHAHFDTFSSVEKLFQTIPTTRAFDLELSGELLAQSYYFQQRSSFVVVPENGNLSSGARDYIRASRNYALEQARILASLSAATNTIFVPDWWTILAAKLHGHPNEDVRRATSLADYVFSQDLSVIAQLRNAAPRPTIYLSLISRAFFQNLTTGISSLFVSHCHEAKFRFEDVPALLKDSICTLIYTHCRFLSAGTIEGAITLLVTHLLSHEASYLGFKAAQHAVDFIVLHELAHLALHSQARFCSTDGLELHHHLTYSFPDLQTLTARLRLRNETSAAKEQISELERIALKLAGKTVSVPHSVPAFAEFETSGLLASELQEIEADAWAFERALEMLNEGTLVENRVDGLDMRTFNSLVIGVYSAIMLMGTYSFTELCAATQADELTSRLPAIERSVRLRADRFRAHVAAFLRDRYFYPEPIVVIDRLSEYYIDWFVKRMTGEAVMDLGEGSASINSLMVSVRCETSGAHKSQELATLIDSRRSELALDGRQISFVRLGEQKGFGLGEVHDFVAACSTIDAKEVYVALLSSFLYDVAKGTCRRIYIAGKQCLVEKDAIKAALDDSLAASASDQPGKPPT